MKRQDGTNKRNIIAGVLGRLRHTAITNATGIPHLGDTQAWRGSVNCPLIAIAVTQCIRHFYRIDHTQ